jgi:hypothetical protein
MKTGAEILQLYPTTPLPFAVSLFTHLLLTDVGIKRILIGNSFFLICNIGTTHYTSVLCGLMQHDCPDICFSKIQLCYNIQLTKILSHKLFPAQNLKTKTPNQLHTDVYTCTLFPGTY